MSDEHEVEGTFRALGAPFGMINLVKVGVAANALMLDAAEYVASLGAEFIEWAHLCEGNKSGLAHNWRLVSQARTYYAAAKGIAGINLDHSPVINPAIGEFESLTSMDAKDPHRPGGLVTLNMSGSRFMCIDDIEVTAVEGLKMYDGMLLMAQALDVSYASLTWEIEMADVQQVLGGEDPGDFSSFYLSRQLLGEERIEAITDLFLSGMLALNNDKGIGITPYFTNDPGVRANAYSRNPRRFYDEQKIVTGYLRDALRGAVEH